MERLSCVISSIWLNKTDKFILACDGKKFFVYGDSPIATAIRKYAKSSRDETPFADLLSDADDDFDPVDYWYTSSPYFVFGEPPFAFSDEALKNAQDWLTEQKPNSTKI